MSWHSPSPLSPRKPKIQQQSWDEVPKINFYDPSRDEDSGVSSYPGTSLSSMTTKHISKRSGYQKYCLPNPQHQMSDPGSYHSSTSIKSPKSPGSQVFEFELTSTPEKLVRSPLRSRHFHEDSSTSDSAPAILSYGFDAISPKIQERQGSKKFEYFTPSSSNDEKMRDLEMVELFRNVDKTCDDDGSNKLPHFGIVENNKIHFAKCSPRRNRSIKKSKRHYNVSPDGVSSLDEYTITYETNTPSGGRRMSITISDMAVADTSCSEMSSEPAAIESLETSSLATQSSMSRTTTTGSPLPSPTSTHSLATTATCDSKLSQANRPKNLCQKIGEEPDDIISSQESLHVDLHKRRHAINITNNPGYRALHNSHSTLDRTCSDSVVSLRHRKSTSDLTANDEKHHVNNTKHRRRGSSKGGLAYLVEKRDSRRGSRESAISQFSNFSNEDIGPLANFQQTQRGRQRRTSNFLELPVPDHIRPRVCSLPDRPYQPYNPRVSEDLYRLRTFSISKGTVVNCGDSIISRRSRSNTSVNSTTSRLSERSPFDGSCCGGYGGDDSKSCSSDNSEPTPTPRYRIVLLGDAAVGKTALVNQFMTSEYIGTYDASLDDEFGEKTVSILLDGEESELIFIDHPSHEMSVENSLSTYEPHACIIVYSIIQRSSFRCAEEIMNYLWRENVTKDKAVILVGNKADLARSRVITTSEGKQLAASRDVKFIETSSGIQHNVDELLVGILKQIKLKENREKKQSSTKMKNSKTHMSLHMAKEILQKICFNQLDITKSKSCENLHVL